MKIFIYTIICLLAVMVCPSCIDDSVTTSPSAQPVFSTDTLKIGYTFTGEGTPTRTFKVFNRNGKGISISSISLREQDTDVSWRINVDGIAGASFSNVDIRANDSIFVLVEATFPKNAVSGKVKREAHLDFVINGVESTVVLHAITENVNTITDMEVVSDMRLTAETPYRIMERIAVMPGATLTLDAGVRLHFHNKAVLQVDGTLLSNGTASQPVLMDGDRFDQVVGRIPYEIMSGQWTGVRFGPESMGNRMEHTVVRNTVEGVTLFSRQDEEIVSEPELTLLRSRITNSQSTVLCSKARNVTAIGCEFSEGGAGLVSLASGRHVINHCTFSNNYLFAAISGAALTVAGQEIWADVSNCIIYGLGADVSPGRLDGMDVSIRRCLIRSNGTDDDNFIETIWGEDPRFYTVRNDYLFDYRLKPESPAIGAADPLLTMPEAYVDFYGRRRSADMPDLGAYVYVEPETEQPE
ncbi:hypothetical protein [uncultured Muribaculum sp.]|uniref:hypothetical protein n=1 Tax=uncultured Muribaculum sp. TaxID=1918613 RepID=UPI0025B7A2D3|nr:hypothetical protein [uncultured Muribaculum sp.]